MGEHYRRRSPHSPKIQRSDSLKMEQDQADQQPLNISRELSNRMSYHSDRPAYSLGGVTHKKPRGRPRKKPPNPHELEIKMPIRRRPMHPVNRISAPYRWVPCKRDDGVKREPKAKR